MNRKKRQKRCNKNITNLSKSLINLGMPLDKVIETICDIYQQIAPYWEQEEISCQKQQD